MRMHGFDTTRTIGGHVCRREGRVLTVRKTDTGWRPKMTQGEWIAPECRTLGESLLSSLKFDTFTRRTNDPKLSWIETQLDRAGIPWKRDGYSFHAPILKVRRLDLAAAWEILTPVDDILDDDPAFRAELGYPEFDPIASLWVAALKNTI